MIQRALLGAACLLLSAVPVLAQTAAPSGATISRNCYICHGPEGRSPGPMPGLHGMPKEYLQQSLLQFKADKRPGTIMNRIAKGYSDEQIEAVAGYIAGLK